jgi:phosphatidylglycerophosphate synthase
MTMTTSRVQSRSSSLRELRAIAQPPEHSPSPTDCFYRAGSIFVSVPLAWAGASPNVITLVWIALGLIGAFALSAEQWGVRVGGALVLQLSYLLDYVDGEVARLSDRKSLIGGFLDLMGHGLIKPSLPLAVGWVAATMTDSAWFLLTGAAGAIAVAVGDSLRFYAACTSGDLGAGDLGHTVAPRKPRGARRITLTKLMVVAFELAFESPGLYGLALVAAVSGEFAALSVFWMVGGSVWMVRRARRYCRRLDLATQTG